MSCVGQIPSYCSSNTHSIMPISSIIRCICEIASGKLKYACCTETKAKGISTSSYFLHKVTVSMATVWWLVLPPYSLSIFHSSPFISAISLFEDLLWPLWVCSPPPSPTAASSMVLYFSSIPPPSLSFPFWKTKWKSKKSDYRRDNVLMVYKWCNIKVCVFFSDKNETERGSLRYQRPPHPVRCWAQAEWGKVSCCFVISFPLLVRKWTADTD